MLKMKQLAEASGVSAGTIKHYLREGLLGNGDAVVKTSRNMAYYPPEFVERIKLIKQLQEERFMPLSVIKSMLGGQVSPITRDVLVSGNNPMLAKTGAGDSATNDSASMMPRGGAGAGGRNIGGLGLGRGQLPPASTRPINLQGLPQVIGLALGAPEFQRR